MSRAAALAWRGAQSGQQRGEVGSSAGASSPDSSRDSCNSVSTLRRMRSNAATAAFGASRDASVGQRRLGDGAHLRQRRAQARGPRRGREAALAFGHTGAAGRYRRGGKRRAVRPEIRTDRLRRRIGRQCRHRVAGAAQHRERALQHQQAQPDHRQQRQRNAAEQGEVDAPLGPVPAFAFGGHHQQTRRLAVAGGSGDRTGQTAGQRAAGMAVGQDDVVIARRAARGRADRQAAAAAGRSSRPAAS
jgi:hypothetical protein